ncbi:MAG: hypothetical protein AAF518_05010 [Spirochaetota bacterium]
MSYEDFDIDFISSYSQTPVSTVRITSRSKASEIELKAKDVLDKEQLEKLQNIRKRRVKSGGTRSTASKD